MDGDLSLATLGQRAWQILGILLVLAALYWVSTTLSLVVISIILGVMIAATVAPLVDRLDEHVPRGAAALIVTVGGVLLLAAVIGLLGWRVAGQVPQLADQLSQALERLGREFPMLEVDGDLREQITSALGAGAGADQAMRGLATSAKVLSGLALSIVLSFFFVRDGRKMWRSFLRMWSSSSRPVVDHMGRSAYGTLSHYVHGLTLVAATEAILTGIALALLGVPLALVLAALTFFGAFVPTIGAFTVGALATAVAFTSGGLVLAALTAGLYTLVQQLESNILSPWIMGHQLPLHPAAVLLALTIGALLAGIMGALLGVPIAAAVVAAARAYLGTGEDDAAVGEGAPQAAEA